MLLQVFYFQYDGYPPSWIIKIYKFSHSARFAVKICVHAKFCCDRLRSYCKFSISNMAAICHLGFAKHANFHLPHGLRSQSAYSCKILSQSVEILHSYCKFLISNMAAVHHLGFFVRMHGTTSKVA